MNSPNKQRGTSMIEVLVAISLLAIGLLGYAQLQTRALAATHSAWLRSQATLLANDISERMRVNRAAALGSQYNISIGALPGSSSLAATDLGEWKQNLAAALPGGDGAINVTGNGQVTLTIRWNDPQQNPPTTTFFTQTAL